MTGLPHRPYRDPGRRPSMSDSPENGSEFVTQAGRGRMSNAAPLATEPKESLEERAARVEEMPTPTSKLTSRPA
jgi:hypothetical protein